MGNSNQSKICAICVEKLPNLHVNCFRCNTKYHIDCEMSYRSDQGYCQCPNCGGMGTLAIKTFNHKSRSVPIIETYLV